MNEEQVTQPVQIDWDDTSAPGAGKHPAEWDHKAWPVKAGNIGEPVRHIEFEPLPEHAPIQEPSPVKQPEKVPA